MYRFKDRDEAGRMLAERLMREGFSEPVVLGIPRGGVVPAEHVARLLHGELGVVVARKLRAPYQPELAIGAVTADGISWINEELAADTRASPAYLEKEQAVQAAEAARREKAFDGRHRPPVAGRVVIIVDDGVATGATAIAAIRSIKAAGAARVVLAVPVGPPDTLSYLASEADQVISLQEPSYFDAVGQFYRQFEPVVDTEVRAVLDRFYGPGESASAEKDAALDASGGAS